MTIVSLKELKRIINNDKDLVKFYEEKLRQAKWTVKQLEEVYNFRLIEEQSSGKLTK